MHLALSIPILATTTLLTFLVARFLFKLAPSQVMKTVLVVAFVTIAVSEYLLTVGHNVLGHGGGQIVSNISAVVILPVVLICALAALSSHKETTVIVALLLAVIIPNGYRLTNFPLYTLAFYSGVVGSFVEEYSDDPNEFLLADQSHDLMRAALKAKLCKIGLSYGLAQQMTSKPDTGTPVQFIALHATLDKTIAQVAPHRLKGAWYPFPVNSTPQTQLSQVDYCFDFQINPDTLQTYINVVWGDWNRTTIKDLQQCLSGTHFLYALNLLTKREGFDESLFSQNVGRPHDLVYSALYDIFIGTGPEEKQQLWGLLIDKSAEEIEIDFAAAQATGSLQQATINKYVERAKSCTRFGTDEDYIDYLATAFD